MTEPTNVRQLAEEVLKKFSIMPIKDGQYHDSTHIGYINIAVTAAPILARSWLEKDAKLRIYEPSINKIDELEAAIEQQQAEIERLRAEISRVAPFLAVHGVEGYTIEDAP